MGLITSLLADRAGEAMALNDRHLNPQLGRIVRTLGFDRQWAHGEGAHLVDADGRRYLDLLCGYGVFAVGRNHPDVIAALEEVMAARTPNLPQLGVSLLPGVLAERLLECAPASVDAVVPANSGAEAVEAAIKLSRAATGRPRVLYLEHAFHGLTLGALSLNGNEEFRSGFGPLVPDCTPIALGDLVALERGVRHGSTFGGNDLAAAAGLATLEVLEREGLVERAARLGDLLLELTRPLVDRYEVVREVRGLGLMWAIEFGPPRGAAARSLWRAVERAQPGLFAQLITVPLFHEHRILCQVAGHRMNVVKALPALVVSEDDIRGFAV